MSREGSGILLGQVLASLLGQDQVIEANRALVILGLGPLDPFTLRLVGCQSRPPELPELQTLLRELEDHREHPR